MQILWKFLPTYKIDVEWFDYYYYYYSTKMHVLPSRFPKNRAYVKLPENISHLKQKKKCFLHFILCFWIYIRWLLCILGEYFSAMNSRHNALSSVADILSGWSSASTLHGIFLSFSFYDIPSSCFRVHVKERVSLFMNLFINLNLRYFIKCVQIDK